MALADARARTGRAVVIDDDSQSGIAYFEEGQAWHAVEGLITVGPVGVRIENGTFISHGFDVETGHRVTKRTKAEHSMTFNWRRIERIEWL